MMQQLAPGPTNRTVVADRDNRAKLLPNVGPVLAQPGTAWSIYGPALITFLLLRVSGVTLLERTLETSRPDYRDYKRRTSAFFPWPPAPGTGAG